MRRLYAMLPNRRASRASQEALLPNRHRCDRAARLVIRSFVSRRLLQDVAVTADQGDTTVVPGVVLRKVLTASRKGKDNTCIEGVLYQ